MWVWLSSYQNRWTVLCRFVLMLIILGLGNGVCSQPAFADQAVLEEDARIADAVEPAERLLPEGPDLERERKLDTVTISLAVLLGILIMRLTLLAITMLLGRRMRRISKDRVYAKPLDPLWYLKAKSVLDQQEEREQD